MLIDPRRPFRWQDGERTIVFGRGAVLQAGELLGEGYTLLTTPRARGEAPTFAKTAAAVHEVGPGRVDEVAASLRPSVRGALLVALGGGHVIDVAKALAAADPPRRVAAIPTTLSGAEMTAVHRHAVGVAPTSPHVRPAIVVTDPALSASQPPVELAGSAANALGHALEGMVTLSANPVATLAGLAAARLIVAGLGLSSAVEGEGLGHSAGEGEGREPGRDALALAALLAGYTIGSAGYGLHHVLAQTLARFAGVPHGAANAAMLPHSLVALKHRFPESLGDLGAALGEDPVTVAARLAALAHASRLAGLGASEAQLERCAEEAVARAELHMTPPAAEREELQALYLAAF